MGIRDQLSLAALGDDSQHGGGQRRLFAAKTLKSLGFLLFGTGVGGSARGMQKSNQQGGE
jgi:hypothetical protein